MSQLSDYSKFDHLDEEDSDDDEQQQQQSAPVTNNPINQSAGQAAVPQSSSPSPHNQRQQELGTSMRKNESNGRYVFEFNGNPIYEWEQKLDDVVVYVKSPVTRGDQIVCEISPKRLKLGLKSASQFFISEETFGTVDVSESTWSLEDDDDNHSNNGTNKVIVIYLIKAHRGELWDTALKGNESTASDIDPMAKEQVRKDLLLERFQEENPGFDFRDAEFNGSVPDARTFMGGVKY